MYCIILEGGIHLYVFIKSKYLSAGTECGMQGIVIWYQQSDPLQMCVSTKLNCILTRNIFKKDIRRLWNTDDKRNQIRWFRRNSHLPLCMLESKAKLWSCFCLSFTWFCAHLTFFAERYASDFFFNFRHSPARVWEQCFKSLVF